MSGRVVGFQIVFDPIRDNILRTNIGIIAEGQNVLNNAGNLAFTYISSGLFFIWAIKDNLNLSDEAIFMYGSLLAFLNSLLYDCSE